MKGLRKRVAASLSLRQYCRHSLAGPTTNILVPSNPPLKLIIDQVFCPVTLQRPDTRQKLEYSYSSLIDFSSRQVIVGDPGSGKSTLAKRIFRDACLKGEYGPKIARLPILVELRDFPRLIEGVETKSDDWLIAKLREEVAALPFYQMGDCFDAYATSSGLLVILDGLDEIPSDLFLRANKAINGLSKALHAKSPNNVLFVTTRQQYYSRVEEYFVGEFGASTSIDRFSSSDIYRFLARWPFPESEPGFASKIYSTLMERPTLKDMCGNPLVLSMFVAEAQNAGLVLVPDSRTDFYNKITDELLYRRRIAQLQAVGNQTLLKKERYSILGQICYEHMLQKDQPANQIPFGRAVGIVRSQRRMNTPEAERYLEELIKETGIFSHERERESLRFMHLTFCEFLAAHYAANGHKDGWSALVNSQISAEASGLPGNMTRLAEVIPFAAGLLPSHLHKKCVVDAILLRANRVPALIFLETKAYETDRLEELVARWQLEIREGRSSGRRQSIDDLYLLGVLCSDADQCSNPSDAQGWSADFFSFVRSLGGGDKAAIIEIVEQYSLVDEIQSLSLLKVCGLDIFDLGGNALISGCAEPTFLGYCLHLARGESGRAADWALILGEAALRYRSVWDELNSTQTIPEIRNAADTLSKEKRWYQDRIVRRSPATECLSLALSALEFKDRSVLAKFDPKALVALKSVPPPGRHWREALLFPYTVTLMCLFAGSSFLAGHVSKDSLWRLENIYLGGQVTLLSVAFLYGIFLPATFIAYRVPIARMAYRRILRGPFGLRLNRANDSGSVKRTTIMIVRLTEIINDRLLFSPLVMLFLGPRMGRAYRNATKL